MFWNTFVVVRYLCLLCGGMLGVMGIYALRDYFVWGCIPCFVCWLLWYVDLRWRKFDVVGVTRGY